MRIDMGQSTNGASRADNAAASHVIEEIAFQASILALRAAIEPAATDGQADAVQRIQGSLLNLVERARTLAQCGPDLRGL